jgi:two-component system OmpR family sensor kinase
VPRGPLVRLPLRWKLTLVYVGVISVALAGVGTFLYFHFESGLDASFNDGLSNRAAAIAAATRHGSAAGARRIVASGEGFAQVIGPDGAIRIAGPGRGGSPLLSPEELGRARRARYVVDRGEQDRILAEPLAGRPGWVVVAGASLEQREGALEQLGAGLLIGIPLSILLAAAAAYAVAAGALRPVDLMRRRARSISAADAGARLPLPAAEDELHRLGATLNEMLERLQASVERERSFVADASHELRTPLAVLRAEIDVALRGDGGATELRQALVNAGAETDRLMALAEDLLVVAREDQGGLPLDRRVADVDELLEGVRRRFDSRVQGSDRSISIDAPPGMTLRCDPRWLARALANLVDNALRHGSGDVALSAEASDGVIELHVRDCGAGFPDAFLPRAFERFTRAGTGRAGEGTGLGLAIVRAVARAHGGEAGAANRRGGSDVWVSLPAGQPARR